MLPLFSLAQSNYKPGYVVTLKGDTLHGFIDYREWSSNPNSIDFKTITTDSKSQEFTPKEISYFTINGMESYQRYSGLISMDATDLDHLGYSRDTSTRMAAVFFRILQKGSNLALYSYTDNLKARFYIGESPDYSPVALGYRLYYNRGSDIAGQKGATVNENTYMKQLFALANKYQGLNNDLQWDIEHAGYNSDNILEVVSKINHISKAENKKNDALKGPAFNLFIGAAVNINNTSTPDGSPFYNGGGRSYTSYLPAVSFGANFFANRSTRKLQFRLEAGIAESQFRSSYMLKVDPYIPFKASYDEVAFTFSPQIIYNFYNTENLKVYGGLGASLCFYTFSNSYLGSQSQPNSASDIQATDPYFFNTADNLFVFKAGVQFYKNWGIFAQYLGGATVTRGGYFQMSSSGEQIGLNYFFE
jgi:hypothetical protein